jgi:hypothetical protein
MGWYLESRTVETAYKPFAGMILGYVVMLWQEGPVICRISTEARPNSRSVMPSEHGGEIETTRVEKLQEEDMKWQAWRSTYFVV